MSKVKEKDPSVMMPLSQARAPLPVVVWTPSVKFHVTESPRSIVTVLGEKKRSPTVTEAVEDGGSGVGTGVGVAVGTVVGVGGVGVVVGRAVGIGLGVPVAGGSDVGVVVGAVTDVTITVPVISSG